VTENPPLPDTKPSIEDNTDSHNSSNPKKIRFRERVKQIFQAIKPIITSHHPKCEQYKDHTFHLFGRDWCIGCYIGYPSGILMLIIGFSTGLFSSLSSRTLWIIGGSLMCSYLLSIVGLTKIRWIKIVSKIPLGVGVAFIIGALFSYDVKFWFSFLLSFLLVQFFITVINVKRAIEMKKTCAVCEYESDHNNCPGMHPVMEKLNKIKKNKI
jgi:hypothetical protein